MGVRCKKQLLFLIFAMHLCLVPALSYDDEETLNQFDFPDTDPATNSEIQKRFSKFVRIGRGLSSFMRIGRNFLSEPSAFYQLKDVPDDKYTDSNEGAFYDFEPTDFETGDKSLSPYVRFDNEDGNEDENTGAVVKRGGAFIRMGKFPTSAFLGGRSGKVTQLSPAKYYRRTGRIGHSSFIRIGKRDTTDAVRRMNANENEDDNNGLERYHKYRDENGTKRWLTFGRDIDDDKNVLEDLPDVSHTENDMEGNAAPANKRFSSFVRIGRNFKQGELESSDTNNGPAKRYSSFVRIGRDADKRRFSSFVRIGKSLFAPQPQYSSDIDKRLSSFVRIGKSYNPYQNDMDKRFSSFVRIGRNYEPEDSDIDKRYSSFVRIGKSSDDDLVDDVSKRFSKFVRIGKNVDNEDLQKRLSAFVRVGKGLNDDNDEGLMDKRYSSFVRIGKSIPDQYKRYSSFVRIGKSMDDQPDKRLSAFMRVGKDNIGTVLSDGEVSLDPDAPTYITEEQGHILDKRSSSNNNNENLETEDSISTSS
ncbi:hypothetical protein ACF0H5_015819 [Mactra antiquata]